MQGGITIGNTSCGKTAPDVALVSAVKEALTTPIKPSGPRRTIKVLPIADMDRTSKEETDVALPHELKAEARELQREILRREAGAPAWE